MTSVLMKGVSGIRGVVGETLTPDLICTVGSAFALYAGRGRVVIGRDTRPSGPAIEKGLESSLLLSGCSVIRLGAVPTPTLQVMVEETKADGGIMISASHNPIEWNAFKLVGRRGCFLTSKEINDFFKMMDLPFEYPPWDGIGVVTQESSVAEETHLRKILSVIDVDRIRKRAFRVVLDSVNGAGSRLTLRLLDKLGCSVVPIHCEMSGLFPRGAEPVPENLTDLSRVVKEENAGIGFAQDPDADRLAIVDEQGTPIGEEYTIALVTDHQLSKRSGRVVINQSTTKAVDDIAMRYGAPIARTRVGEINVVEEMMRHGARIGGEGNGGVISPEVHMGRDSLVGIAYILEMLATRGGTVSELVGTLPRYSMKKGKLELPGGVMDESVLGRLASEYRSQKTSRIDGLRIEFIDHDRFEGAWVHMRPSNTEPIFRIIAEGKDPEQAAGVYEFFERVITG
ncbi:MAG: phosphoglucosamine mutase [Spirochaetes bacterium]|nr:phosphoglucosamine mutase [Spirochaetota bacterium]